MSRPHRGGGEVDYLDTFILVAEDCPTSTGVVPAPRGGRPTVATIQFELLTDAPYELRQAEILFATFVQQRDIDLAALPDGGTQLRTDFFAAPKPCLRASPLPKRFGWGVHFDGEGRAALHALGSEAYERFAAGADGVTVVAAMRTRRADRRSPAAPRR